MAFLNRYNLAVQPDICLSALQLELSSAERFEGRRDGGVHNRLPT
jgi:hypothetical protein